jgi:hypothetical protein
MSIVRLQSSEPLPIIPANLDPSVEHYIRSLHNYLRRITAMGTGQNIHNTLVEEMEGYYLDQKNLEVVVTVTADGSVEISDEDWRGRFFGMRMAVIDGTYSDSKDRGCRNEPRDLLAADRDSDGWYFAGYSDYVSGPDVSSNYDVYEKSWDSVTFSVTMSGTDGSLSLSVSDFSSGSYATYQCRFFVWAGPVLKNSGLEISS